MKTIGIFFALALTLMLSWVGAASEDDGGNPEQDKRVEALTNRVERLEALVGRDERPTPARPSMGRRLDRLEREVHGSRFQAGSPAENVRESIRELNRSLQDTDRRMTEVTRRMDRADRETVTVSGTDDVRSLRRDLDQLQRQDLRSLRRDVDRLQSQLDDLRRKVDRLISDG